MLNGTVLVVDDDALFRTALEDLFTADGMTVLSAASTAMAREQLEHRPDVVILDQRLPDGSGLDLIEDVIAANPQAKTIMVTADGCVADAVSALKRGIVDYVQKPLDVEALRLAVLRAVEHGRLAREAEVSRLAAVSLPDPLACVPEHEALALLVSRAAKSKVPVLITGETGTGKSMIARSIHRLGSELERPFIAVNCASIPENLVEAELFGVERGAYTGAHAPRQGQFELADQGTLFLDEIGEMPLALQSKLLTVLEDGVVRRVGATRGRRIDVRIIAATNVDLDDPGQNRLRRDLLYRLDVLRIHMRPLRDRLDELPGIVEQLLVRIVGANRHATLAPGEMSRLLEYGWPGNVRELANVLERAMLLQEPSALMPSRFLTNPRVTSSGVYTRRPDESIEGLERAHVLDVLRKADGVRATAARRLGISVATLRRKLNAWGSE